MTVPPLERASAHPRRILIVEDHPDARESLRLLLEIWGHRVEVAASGPEGVEKGLALRPEVALVDIGLPGIDGYEVARRLRAGLGRAALLVAHTAYCRLEDQERARAAGFDLHLPKPIDIDKLSLYLVHKAGPLEETD